MFVGASELKGDELRKACERNYNNRALVPEHPQILASWPTDAQAFRDAADAEFDLAYLEPGSGGTERTRLDLFWPKDADKRTCPIAMFIHGGYWQALDRKAASHLARGITGQGVAAALPSYDLCPDVSLGAIIEQISAACLWLWRRHGRRIAVSGHSAGGHLAASMLATDFSRRDKAAPADIVAAATPISGIFDLRDLVHSSINDKVSMTLNEAEAWSPMFAPAPAGKTMHAIVGGKESEAFLWQSRTLADLWSGQGVTASWAAPEGENHFTVVAPLTDPDSAMSQGIAEQARMAAARR